MGRSDAETETLIPMLGGFPDAGAPSHPLSAQAHPPLAVIALAGNTIGRAEHNGGNGTGFCDTGECYTLTKTDVHGVAISFEPTIAYRTNAAGQVMPQADACATLNTQTDPTGQFLLMNDVVGALRSNMFNNSDPMMEAKTHIVQQMQVRRLTPRECERLQGFKDDYSLIPSDVPISKVRREKLDMDYVKYLHRGGRLTFEQCMNAAADGPRYKALGNSMAVPVMHWIGRRIELALAEPWPELIP